MNKQDYDVVVANLQPFLIKTVFFILKTMGVEKMVKIKPVDVTAKRIGSMLRRARYMCSMSMDDASYILRIMPDELVAYERGIKQIPLNILEHMFIMGYKMMQVRIIEHRYHNQRMQYRKIKETNADATE